MPLLAPFPGPLVLFLPYTPTFLFSKLVSWSPDVVVPRPDSLHGVPDNVDPNWRLGREAKLLRVKKIDVLDTVKQAFAQKSDNTIHLVLWLCKVQRDIESSCLLLNSAVSCNYILFSL